MDCLQRPLHFQNLEPKVGPLKGGSAGRCGHKLGMTCPSSDPAGELYQRFGAVWALEPPLRLTDALEENFQAGPGALLAAALH